MDGGQARDLLLNMFSHVPTLSRKTPFLLVELDGCEIYIPINEVTMERVDLFADKIKELYSLTQKK